MTSKTLKTFRIIAFVAFIIGVSYGTFFGQQINTISSRCPSPNQLTKSSVKALANGDITYTPCSVGASVFTGAVDFSGATITGAVTGSGTINFIPRFTAGSAIGNTPFSWDGSIYSWNNTGLTCEFCMLFTPSGAGTGSFVFGDATGAGQNYFSITNATSTAILNAAVINANVGAGVFTVGDIASVNSGTTLAVNDATSTVAITAAGAASSGIVTIDNRPNGTTSIGQLTGGGGMGFATKIVLNDAAAQSAIGSGDGSAGTRLVIDYFTTTYDFNVPATTGIFDLDGILNYKLFRTITTAGTTGARTINRPNGTVNFAAGATALVVTNSVANATSTINAMAQTNDATCAVKNIARGVGSFTINMTAACTAETAVAFWVYN